MTYYMADRIVNKNDATVLNAAALDAMACASLPDMTSAVQMAQHIFADLGSQTALLIGAGETVQLLARHLKTRGVGRIIDH